MYIKTYIMENKETQLTSVKVHKQSFEDFKVNSIRFKFSFTKLVDRAMYLYNTDPEFKKMIHNVKVNFKSSEE